MNKPQQFKAKVSEHILINEAFQYIQLELLEPYRMAFEAGQFVSIDIGGGERRSYSIASAPVNNHGVEICVDVTPGGKGSHFLKGLKPGDEVNFLGPMGQLVVAPQSLAAELVEKKLLLVATGSGIAPFRSMILDLLGEREDKREIRLYWGLRSVSDMFWVEDFRRLHKFHDNFDFTMCLSKPPKHWPLNAGHVTELIDQDIKFDANWGVYLCGNQHMIKDVSSLVEGKGVPKEQVHFERFF